jgi:hypothetical protein
MKKLYIIIAILISLGAYSQEMKVHKTNGTVESFLISQIDSITFNTSSVIPTEGLLAYYPFNGNANDESGNGNNGTVNGATLTSDRFSSPNKAYDFAGNYENNITISPFILPETISISIWFNPITDGPSGDHMSVLLANQQKFVNNNAIVVDMEAGKVRFAIINIAGEVSIIQSGSPITLNHWHHLVCIIDQNKVLKMHLDNVIQNETDSWQGTYNGQAVTGIGNHYQDNDSFDGAMDDVRIYDRELSVLEIQALFNEGK